MEPQIVVDAREFALFHHKNQKYGDQPYSVHLAQVAALASPYGHFAEAAGWLHDVAEDTDVTIKDIATFFGFAMGRIVSLLSDEAGPTRAIRKMYTHKKLAEVSAKHPVDRVALIVKACDRLANVERSVRDPNGHGFYYMYVGEHPAFRTAVYRPGLCEDIWTELDNHITPS